MSAEQTDTLRERFPEKLTRVRGVIREATRSDPVVGYGLLIPVILLITAVAYIPISWAIYGSLFSIEPLSLEQNYIGLENYTKLLFHDPDFWTSMFLAGYFAIGSTVLQLAVALPTALILNKQLKGVGLARAIALLPYLMPTIVVALAFRWMMHADLGVFSVWLQSVGLADGPVNFLGSSTYALPSIIVAGSWKFTAFMTMIFLARIQSIPSEYYEAAIMCGATKWEQFRDVTLPSLRNVILLAVLLRGIWMFNKFDIVYLMTEGGPQFATTTAPVYVYRLAFIRQNFGEALATSTLLFVILLIGGLVYLWLFDPADEV